MSWLAMPARVTIALPSPVQVCAEVQEKYARPYPLKTVEILVKTIFLLIFIKILIFFAGVYRVARLAITSAQVLNFILIFLKIIFI